MRNRPASMMLAVVGGVGLTLAFPESGIWFAAPLGVAALVGATTGNSIRWNVFLGWIFGLATFTPMLWWAYVSVGIAPWLGLSAVESAFIASAIGVWTWVRRAPWARSWWVSPVLLGTLWVAAEEIRSAWPFGGFPWGRVAFAEVDSPFIGLARIGGAPLVSWATVTVGVLVFEIVRWAITLARKRIGEDRDVWRPMVGASVVMFAVLFAGMAVPLSADVSEETLRVGVVQGNVPGRGLDAFGHQWQVLRNHLDGTDALLSSVEPGYLDLVVWPENGSDIDPQVDGEAAWAINGAAVAVGSPILVGTVEYPESGGRYNTSVLWVPDHGVVATYSKQHPAPFAEYIPMRPVARLFSDAVDLVTYDMLAGRAPGVIPLDSQRLGRTVHVGDVICFEVAYDGLVRESVVSGGELLVVQTNNASFDETAESTQQLAMTRFRAVEFARSAVQVSTVGVSAVIRPDGSIDQSTTLFTADQIIAEMQLSQSLTPAVLVAPVLGRSTVLLSIGFMVAALVRDLVLLRSARLTVAS